MAEYRHWHKSNCLNSSAFEHADSSTNQSNSPGRNSVVGSGDWEEGKKDAAEKEKRKKNATFPVLSIGMPEISRMREISDSANASNCRKEGMQSHVCTHCSPFLPLSYFAIPFSSLRPMVSRSLRYSLRSRTHVVVRMHTRAYTRRVLRKLAPYASIQISHLATCVSTPSDQPMWPSPRSASRSPLYSSLSLSIRWSPIFSNLTGPYRSRILTCGQKYLTVEKCTWVKFCNGKFTKPHNIFLI